MRSRLVLFAFIGLACSTGCLAQSSASSTPVPPSETRKTSDPYRGDLSVFDSPGRAERLEIDRVMQLLQINPGTTVADIGAGSGWFTVRAARRVGPNGSVFAVDINPEATKYIEQRSRRENLRNVEVILSEPDDPKLPLHAVDAVLLLKTYHEVAHPVTLLRNLRASLRPGARIGIIDRMGNGENHGVNREVVIREAMDAGYVAEQQLDWKRDGMDYFLILRARE
ncbi:MAG TPA: class I SAM-dependent methyltransferase [Terriglobales bacterium]|nr:class I SAM-dependent methyltransferase [Terriglobales bacterium]